MVNKRSGKQTMKGFDPMGRGLILGPPDNPGGYMYQGNEGGSSVKPAAGNNGKGMMMDGPYGGKVKA